MTLPVRSILVDARDMLAVAKVFSRERSSTLRVSEEDISAAYSACCSLPYLFCPAYLIREVRELAKKETEK